MVRDESALAAARTLVHAAHLAGPDDLPALLSDAGTLIGASAVELYLIDYDQTALVPLEVEGKQPLPTLPVDGTMAGRAFTDISQQLSLAEDETLVWTIALDGTDRLGVVCHHFPATVTVDESVCKACHDAAALCAELVVTRTSYGDSIERTRRHAPMSLPAEMQWRLLPPLTFVSPDIAVAGVLAPTHEVAGDSFDYALNRDTAHVVVFDAMGHGLEATLLASVAMGAQRNARRSGLGLGETVALIDRALAEQFGPDKFVTGIIGELEISTGWWRWVTCGHPPALLLRSGRIVKFLDAVVEPPMGLGAIGDPPAVGEERLQPGDRLVLYTDGVVEARDSRGEFFTPERLADFVTRQAADQRPLSETLRRLNIAILNHQQGALQDDATTVMVEWRGDQAAIAKP